MQDIYKQTGKQVSLKEMGIGAMTGGALGGMGKIIMEALKKRKKTMPITAPKTMPKPMLTPPGMMPGLRTLERKYKEIKQGMPERKPAKELQDLKKQKRWAY